MRMKTTTFPVLALIAILFTGGCATTLSTPRTSGIFAGKALYLAYNRNIDKQSPEVKAKIEELWAEINKVKDVSDLQLSRNLIDNKFEEILANSSLAEADKDLFRLLKDDICLKIDEVINAKLASNQEGVEFLVGVREGVNSMATTKK